ncbi:MAG TPA: protein-glutamate O-methyltransferase CheR, partial [Syntrophomonas sp.]|nr:protein-glutamate O-methyltransferase CheR [Syntrophomonas sp.]
MSDEEFNALTSYTKNRYGLDLSHKRVMVEGRLQNFLSARGYDRFSQYFQHLLNDPNGAEANALMNRLTTNYTFFMREVRHFEYFRETILPYLASTAGDRDLRIWSAGCSSGEEPYTLAMIMDDYFGKAGFYWDKKILATDISVQALDTAARAVYSAEQIKGLPGQWRLNYFERVEDGSYRLKQSIRDEVIFRKFNLMESYF